MDAWLNTLQSIYQLVVTPIVIGAFYYFKQTKAERQLLSERVTNLESRQGILEERISNMKEDISEIKSLLHEILNKIKEK